MSTVNQLKGISDADKKMIEQIENMMGPEPEELGLIKNLFWGRVREDLLRPYPVQTPQEDAKCSDVLRPLEAYLKHEHPSFEIDEKQEIPDWCLKKLFELGVMGLTIPSEYGGLGLGITSYNRVLELIGSYCGSTAVLVSAHQSIGCKAVMLFGTPEQKETWLPRLATDTISAFCLSEPNVGCDAAGQETIFEKMPDGGYRITGEKKWSTSGALAGFYTVMAKDKQTGKISAFICTPDMPGFEVFEHNRSKCGIRGTWQARIRLTDVTVPKDNILHTEGRGLQVALNCLNYGRCTLSAGMLGAAQASKAQAIKWSQTRYQFKQPLAYFELVKQKVARMSALTYAMDAMLYMTTGMLDRHDKDIMVETATCKVFCSEMGWRVINDAVQIMGGEGYMTENKVERAFRDNRIHLIVEGANEVMQAFIFAYGGKQLAEQMLGIKYAFSWQSGQSIFGNLFRLTKTILNPKIVLKAMGLGITLFLQLKKAPPKLAGLHPQIHAYHRPFTKLVRDLNFHFKQASKRHREDILNRQVIQSRIADAAMWIYAMGVTLSKLERDLKLKNRTPEIEDKIAAGIHFLELAQIEAAAAFKGLTVNADDSMRNSAEKALAYNDTLPNEDFAIPERFRQKELSRV